MPDTIESPQPLPIYYHGSPVILHVGEYIEPPIRSSVQHIDTQPVNSCRVFVTTVYLKAVHYAFTRAILMDLEPGKVYRVKPTGKLTPDPTDYDAVPPNAFFTSSAQILEVITPSPDDFDVVRRRLLPGIGMSIIGDVLGMAAAFVTGARGEEPLASLPAPRPIDTATRIARASAIVKECRDMATVLQAEADARNGMQPPAGST
jgi:hypothetical protein